MLYTLAVVGLCQILQDIKESRCHKYQKSVDEVSRRWSNQPLAGAPSSVPITHPSEINSLNSYPQKINSNFTLMYIVKCDIGWIFSMDFLVPTFSKTHSLGGGVIVSSSRVNPMKCCSSRTR